MKQGKERDDGTFDPTDFEGSEIPSGPLSIRALPSNREGFVEVTISERQAQKYRDGTQYYRIYFVPYSIFKGSDMSATGGWEKLKNSLAASQIVHQFDARMSGGDQMAWVAQTYGLPGWYVATGVNNTGVESTPTYPFPSPWNPVSDGGLSWDPDDELGQETPPDVTDPSILVQANPDENFGSPTVRLKISFDLPDPLGSFESCQLYVENYNQSDRYFEWVVVNRGTQETGTVTAYWHESVDCPSSSTAFTVIKKISARNYRLTGEAGSFSNRLTDQNWIALWNSALGTVEHLRIVTATRSSDTVWYVTTDPFLDDSVRPDNTEWIPENVLPEEEDYALIYRQGPAVGGPGFKPHTVKFYFVSLTGTGKRRVDWMESPVVILPFGIRGDMCAPTNPIDLTVTPLASTLVLEWRLPDDLANFDDSIKTFHIYRRRMGTVQSQPAAWDRIPEGYYGYASVPIAELQVYQGKYQYTDRKFNIDATKDPYTPNRFNYKVNGVTWVYWPSDGFDFDPINPGVYEYCVTSISKTGFENRHFVAGNSDPERNHYYREVLGDTQETDVGPVRDSSLNRLFNTAFHAVPYMARTTELAIIPDVGLAIPPIPAGTRPDIAGAALYSFGYWYSAEAYVVPRWTNGGNALLWPTPDILGGAQKVDWRGTGNEASPVPTDARATELLKSEAIYPKWNQLMTGNAYGKFRYKVNSANPTGTLNAKVLQDDDEYSLWSNLLSDDLSSEGPKFYYGAVVTGGGYDLASTSRADNTVQKIVPGDGSWVYVYWQTAGLPAGIDISAATYKLTYKVKTATGQPVYYYWVLSFWDASTNWTWNITYSPPPGVTPWWFATNWFPGTAYLTPYINKAMTTESGDKFTISLWMRCPTGPETVTLAVGPSNGDPCITFPGGPKKCQLIINDTGERGVSSGEVSIQVSGTNRTLMQLIRRDHFFPGEALVSTMEVSLIGDGLKDVSVLSSQQGIYEQCGQIQMYLCRYDGNSYTRAADGILTGGDYPNGMIRDWRHCYFPIDLLQPLLKSKKQRRNWMRFHGHLKIPDAVMVSLLGGECRGTGWCRPDSNARKFNVLAGIGPLNSWDDSWIMSTLVITDVGGGGVEERHIILGKEEKVVAGGRYWQLTLKEDLVRGATAAGFYVLPKFTHYGFGFGRNNTTMSDGVTVGTTLIGEDGIYSSERSIAFRRIMVNGGAVGAPWTNELYYAPAPGQTFAAEEGSGGYVAPPIGPGPGAPGDENTPRDPDTVCVHGRTPILMATGLYRAAEEIRPGDKIAAVSNGRVTVTKVTEIHPSQAKELYTLKDREGNALTCTGSHRVAKNSHRALRWVKVWDVAPGDHLLAVEQGLQHLTEVLAIEKHDESATVYTFSCEPHHNYVAATFISHNKRNRGHYQV